MMLTIGRTVSGENTMRVSNSVVSGTHCKIFLDKKSNIMYIEDLGSTNGTYVNGVQVVRYALKVDDKILLGGDGGYATTLREILKYVEEQKSATQKGESNNNPQKQKAQEEHIYAEEFAQLKGFYDKYHKETLEIKDKMGSLMMWRIIPTSILGVITAIFAFFLDTDQMRNVLTLCSAIMTLVIFIVASKITTKLSHKYNALLLERQEEFQLSYVCPKCRSDFGNRSWAALHNRGCCPTCKAKFK